MSAESDELEDVIDGTKAKLLAMRVAVKPRKPRSGAPKAPGLTAIPRRQDTIECATQYGVTAQPLIHTHSSR